jgi:GH25 family lysozyme M1 (1,4-beta-N-acetylmuramidase)
MRINRRQFLTAAGGGVAAGLAGAGAGALAITGGSFPIKGIDVASYQGNVNWTKVKNAGLTFAFDKATEGTTYTNPYFASNWAKMNSAGIIRGAYHYGHPSVDAVAQADFFINTVQPVSGDLQMTLDIEVTDGQTPSQVWSWIQAFIAEISSRTGRPGIIYTGFYFWRDSVGNPTNNLNCPLWLAAYVSNPSAYVPPAWSTYSFWQYTDTGHVNGVSGNVDRDAWNGSLSGLNNLRLP